MWEYEVITSVTVPTKALNKLGEDNWELVAVVSEGYENAYILKRRLKGKEE